MKIICAWCQKIISAKGGSASGGKDDKSNLISHAICEKCLSKELEELELRGGDKEMLTTEIGKTAGTVWTHLAKNGKISFTDLKLKTRISPEMLHQAIGWLARENKIDMNQNAKDTYVWLTDEETKKYKPSHREPDAECGARI